MVKKSLLNNVRILYLVVSLSSFLLFYLILNKDTQGIFLFSVIALIVYLLNDNMIIVLTITTVLITILMLINKSIEGLENKQTDKQEPMTKKQEPMSKKKEPMKEPIPKIDQLDIKKMKYNEEKTKMIKELIPLSNALEKIDVDQINTMVNNLNKIIERF